MSAMVAFIIGNQPLPSLSMRRRLRPVSVPENRMGGPPGCTGFGSHQMSWNDTVGESKEAEPGAQRAWHAAMVSSSSSPGRTKSLPCAVNHRSEDRRGGEHEVGISRDT